MKYKLCNYSRRPENAFIVLGWIKQITISDGIKITDGDHRPILYEN